MPAHIVQQQQMHQQNTTTKHFTLVGKVSQASSTKSYHYQPYAVASSRNIPYPNAEENLIPEINAFGSNILPAPPVLNTPLVPYYNDGDTYAFSNTTEFTDGYGGFQVDEGVGFTLDSNNFTYQDEPSNFLGHRRTRFQ